MKSKYIFGILVVLLLVFATGCGKDKEEQPTPVPAQETDTKDSTQDTKEEEIPAEEIVDVDETPAEVTDKESEVTDEESEVTDEESEELATDDEGITDVSDDEPLEGEDMTADNYRVISLKDLRAYPSEMEIKTGTTVEWRNVNDRFQHIIGWRDQKSMGVKAEPILQGESWSFTFNEPVEIQWFSTARPTIQGTISVIQRES